MGWKQMISAIHGTVVLCFNIFNPSDFKIWSVRVKLIVSFPISPYFFHLYFFAFLLFHPPILFSWSVTEHAIQPHLEYRTFFNLAFKTLVL